ncbi:MULTISPECIES: TetR family transcriptional regulator [unclassified Streptomyces]|uniref:acyl-CoA-like ligand-binding transcription factor n=1 Tax=unclassified Streptomyces TaxID=2593676 RepID=UPI00039E7729|nr:MULTISPECIES: TetR family transcriptional regulator [unclassified Streptomyces]MYX35372.1 TetR family transcriptional regulator [Streptomyces sp. SID8377]
MTSVTVPTGPSLRERKKIRTRRDIRRAALRLFEAQGYDGTTVERIAEAAEVSASTVFRYFPTKEDIVLPDDHDPVMVAELRARPAREPVVASLRHALLCPLRGVLADEGALEELRQRLRLVRSVPAVRARMGERIREAGRLLASVTAERLGRPDDDLEVRVVVAAVMGAWSEAVFHWLDSDGTADPGAVLDRSLELLAAGLCR